MIRGGGARSENAYSILTHLLIVIDRSHTWCEGPRVTDIFFSYSSADRERVRPIHDALVAQGFEVFWDQEVPTGIDWDTWIRQHLAKSKCAMAFWSVASVASKNVRHEARIAEQQGKLIPVLLEPLTTQQFPMGLDAQQAANLSNWNGDQSDNEWSKLRREYEAKLMPPWVRQRMDEKDAELLAERGRRQGAERRDKTLQAQIAREAETQQELKRERDGALDEVAALKGTVEDLTRARSESEAKQAKVQQGLALERDSALSNVTSLSATVDELTRARTDAEQRLSKVRQLKGTEIVRSISPFVIAAAVATVGFWTYYLGWSSPQPLLPTTGEAVLQVANKATEAEAQRAKVEEAEQFRAEAQRQANLAADAEAKRQAAEAEQQRLKDQIQRQAKVVAEAQTKLEASQAEQQSQAAAATDADIKRQAAEKAAADADSKRKAAEGEQQRLKEEVRRQTIALQSQADALQRQADVAAAAEAKLRAALLAWLLPNSGQRFPARLANTDVTGESAGRSDARSIDECEQKCAQTAACRVFSFHPAGQCYMYSTVKTLDGKADFVTGGLPNPK
jgi:TIR domain/PAN domain